MNNALTVIFFEDYFVSTILPNESAWEILNVNGQNKQLLYFYINGGSIRNDEFAKERFHSNDNDAYGNFYDTILDSSRTFKRFDLELHPINLLKDIIEQVKSAYAERIISFISDFNINNEIPLNICFVPGINRQSKNLIEDYFIKEGFTIANRADYFNSFVKILQRKGVISSKINLSIVEAYFGDLLFHYIEFNDAIIKKETEVLIGKGIDHRIGNLAKLMVEKAAHKSSSRILGDKVLLEQEIKNFHKKASIEINNFIYNELDVKVELSDFNSARVIIDQRELEKMSAESFQFIKFKYESFISTHSNLARTEKIFLNGDVLSSDAFLQFFQKTFGASKVIKPYDNFIELLSRGIFTNAKRLSGIIDTEEIEIKITVIKKPPLPELPIKKVPPLPEPPVKRVSLPLPPVNGLPPLPPSKNNENLILLIDKFGIALTDLNPQGKVIIEQKTYEAISLVKKINEKSKIKVKDIKDGKILIVNAVNELPPLPPPKKKTNSEFQLN